MTGRWRRSAVLACALFAVATCADAAAIIGVIVTEMSFAALRDSFLVPNTPIGFACAACGLLIAWHRPANRLGWLLLAAGVCQSATAGVTPWLARAMVDGSPPALVRSLGTIYGFAWPWAVSLFIPLALLLFPDGRLPGRRWRVVAAVAIINAPAQVLEFSSGPVWSGLRDQLGEAAQARGRSWIALPDSTPATLGYGSDAVLGLVFVAAIVGLIVRYVRGGERARRQLLWLMLATAVTVIVFVASRVSTDHQPGVPVLMLTVFVLIPVSIAVAVLRHQLLDIRLVWSRSVTYALLTAGVVGVYLALVQTTDVLLKGRLGLGTSLLATLVIAAGFNPIRVWLQRAVDRLLYGERADPVRAASIVTDELSARVQSPEDLLPVLCDALRLPYSALQDGTSLLAQHGARPERCERFALSYGGELTGYLEVGMRPGEHRLDARDRAVLELVAAPIGVALRATSLSRDVLRSRRDIVAAREEERRRLRRDLHDGLGPLLTGVGFQADAVSNVAHTDPDKAVTLAQAIRTGADAALEDVRRLLYELRPIALDGLGLVEAVRRHAQHVQRRADGSPLTVAVCAPQPLPTLPAAVEVVAYRILTEALTNVARHSDATSVEILVTAAATQLLLTVQDDAAPNDRPSWPPGLGLTSMHERVSELDGTVEAGPTPQGGRVHVRIPLETAG
jgi:signal transduction histidine kinase